MFNLPHSRGRNGMKRTAFKKPTKHQCARKGCKAKIELNENFCSDECRGIAYGQAMDAVKKREKRLFHEFKQKVNEKHMTLGKWIKLAQPIFNEYIRLRDKDLPCISCGTTSNVKYDAGHYFNRKSYGSLRFDEDNVHKQCSQNCNDNLGGNLINYRIGLIERIGEKRVDELEARRNVKVKYSIPDIKELIELYKSKIKELK